MEQLFKSFDNGYIKYKNNIISIVIDVDDMMYFNAKQTAILLGYLKPINAIKQHTEKKDRFQLQFIKAEHKQGHPHTLYFSEAGLYKFILRSNMPMAKKFTDWVTEQVLPSIRKYGKYKLSQEHTQQIKILNTKIKRLATMKKNADNEIKTLKQNLKKEKFPTGGLVYVIDFSTNKKEIYRIGRTTNMNRRKEVTNSHTLHKQPVVYFVETKNPAVLEGCVRSLLYNFRYKDQKDFYVCSIKKIKSAFSSCVRGSKKINYKKYSGSKSQKSKTQKGGSISIPDTNIISREIRASRDEIDRLNKKIIKLNKIIFD